jgi:hypothetical protein
MSEVPFLIRIAILRVKLKLKWRKMNLVLDEADCEKLNGKIGQPVSG